MFNTGTRPAVKRVASGMYPAHVVRASGHGNLRRANRADQRVIDVDVDNEFTIQRAPRSHNGRFLRHRPKRSGRCLNYENCTKASPRCQSGKVYPKGLSVNTMLSVIEAATRYPLRKTSPGNGMPNERWNANTRSAYRSASSDDLATSSNDG